MQTHPTWPTTANFTAQALSDSDLRAIAPSVFSPGPMAGLSTRCAFVPTCEIVSALGERGWVPVDVEQQRIRIAARLGFQKHLIRFRRAEGAGQKSSLSSQRQGVVAGGVEIEPVFPEL